MGKENKTGQIKYDRDGGKGVRVESEGEGLGGWGGPGYSFKSLLLCLQRVCERMRRKFMASL